jgi:hypothetical protein
VHAERGKHRLYDFLVTLTTTLACVQTAIVFRLGGNTNWEAGRYMSFESLVFDVEVRLPLGTVVETIAQRIPVNSTDLSILEKSWDYMAPRPGEAFGPNLGALNTRIITPLFVEFYEDARQWLEDEARKTHKVQYVWTLWANVWQFGRIIRNALSHGAGRVDIRDETFVPITWHSITYGHAQNGQSIWTDLSLADLVILVLEMNDELDRLGYPY